MKRPVKIGTLDSWENNRRVFVRWELTNFCNFKCSYCSHANSEIYRDVVLPKTDVLLKAAENLSKYQEPIHIDLFGGEATCVPGYLDLLEYLVIKMPNADFDTVTNASRSVEWFKNFVNIFRFDSDRISFTFSFHIEQLILSEYIEKINVLRNAGFKVYITFVMFDKRFDDAVKAFNEIKDSCSPTQIYLKYLYGGVENGWYTQEQLDWIDANNHIEKIFKVEFDDGSIDFFDINELKKNEWYNFLDWKCLKKHNYVFTQLGQIRYACEYNTKLNNIKQDNIFVNKNFTDRFNEKDEVCICKNKKCDCLDDFALLKWY